MKCNIIGHTWFTEDGKIRKQFTFDMATMRGFFVVFLIVVHCCFQWNLSGIVIIPQDRIDFLYFVVRIFFVMVCLLFLFLSRESIQLL